MSKDEKEYREQLEADGIEVEEEKTDKPVEETPEEQPKEEKTVEEPEKKPEDEPQKKEVLPEQKEFKKRSIYDEYKDKKSELKSEKELRQKFEDENTTLKEKLGALENADTPQEKQEALNDIDEFAEEIGADPTAIRKMQTIFLKSIKPTTDGNLQKDLADFKEWKTQNQSVMETQQFETEFKSVLPQIKSDFPKATDKELEAVKKSLDDISHSKEYHDKSLDYIVFKNKETLSALISPKKRGMETKERKDTDTEDFVFDPNVDITTLSQADYVKWEKAYNKSVKSEDLINDSQKGKMII